MRITAKHIELEVARWFDTRRFLVVPNVSWGLMPYECDLLAMASSRYLYEIEIKVSGADIKADLKKTNRKSLKNTSTS